MKDRLIILTDLEVIWAYQKDKQLLSRMFQRESRRIFDTYEVQ